MNDQLRVLDRGGNESSAIPIHGPAEFEAMRRAGKLAAEVLDMITPYVKPGVTTGELDTRCHDYITGHGAVPAPLNYRGFPKSICTSINHVVCHGIPGDKVLRDGDIINIDITVILEGWHGDTSRMFPVGKVGVKAQRLIDATYEAMMRGIEVVRPGATLGDIGHAIQSFAEGKRFSVVRDFCGHGLGKVFHAPAQRRSLRPTGRRRRAARGHVLHHRADDQRRALRYQDPERRLDRGDQGQVAVRPIRAFDRRHRRRLRDLHPLPRRPAPAPLQHLSGPATETATPFETHS